MKQHIYKKDYTIGYRILNYLLFAFTLPITFPLICISYIGEFCGKISTGIRNIRNFLICSLIYFNKRHKAKKNDKIKQENDFNNFND